MADSLAAVVLAAGAGSRLAPLTRLLPKPLCPVGNVTLLDWALGRAAQVTSSIAVNVHHRRPAIEAHLGGRAHISVEDREALGTAGALGLLRPWIGGRDVLVLNSDSLHEEALDDFVAEWDGERIRLLCVVDAVKADFPGALRYAGAALMPWSSVAPIAAVPSGLYELSWRHAELDLVTSAKAFFDCGTSADYLAANLHCSGGEPVVGDGADVQGQLVRTVVWPGSAVRAGERLTDAVRAGPLTVLVRGAAR